MDNNDLPSTSIEIHEPKRRKHKRKKNKEKIPKSAPTYEKQKDIFINETLEQIRIFREARENWLKSKEAEVERVDFDNELLYGDKYRKKSTRRKLKKAQKSLDEIAKVEEGLEESSEPSPDGEKEVKGILKKEQVDQEEALGVSDVEETSGISDVEEAKDARQRKDFDYGEEMIWRGREEDVGFREDFGFDEESRFFPSHRPMRVNLEEKSPRFKDEYDYDEDDDDDDDLKYGRGKDFKPGRAVRVKDDFKYEQERRKEGGKKGKPLKFTKIPGPEDQCKCDHSGEYTVLVKGVCFCDKPVRPTCIPIIPPAYLNPHLADTASPDAEAKRVDSLEIHRRSFERSSWPKERKKRSAKKDEDTFKVKKEKDEGKLVEIYSQPEKPLKKELPKPSKPLKESNAELKKAKSIQDMKFEIHHRAHARADSHAPLHFEDFLGKADKKSDITLKDQPGTITTPKADSPSPTKRKVTKVPSDSTKEPVKRVPTKSILEKDKKLKEPKAEHGHVHFNNKDQYLTDDLDSNKYYTKYGNAANTHKRKNNKSVMTVLVDSFTEWWRRKSQE